MVALEMEGQLVNLIIEIAPELQAELARQAALQGIDVDAFAACLLERAVHSPDASGKPELPVDHVEVVEAIDQLRSFGKVHRLSLGGMTIRELRHEARP